MTGWLSRGLIVTAVGAILAFAVTVRVAHVDIPNAGAIIMFAGIGYLLVHLGLLGYERGWLSSGPDRRRDAPEPYDRKQYDRNQYDPNQYDRDQYDPNQYGRGHEARGYRQEPAPARQAPTPRPARVDYRRADEQPYAGDPDDTRVMPALRDTSDDDTTVIRRRQQRPDR